MLKLYDRDRKEITLEQYSELSKDRKYVLVNYSELFSGVAISTVWIGIDLSPPLDREAVDAEHKPRIFETLAIFPGGRTGEMRRYPSVEEALVGHKELVKFYRRRFFSALFNSFGSLYEYVVKRFCIKKNARKRVVKKDSSLYY